MASQAPARNTTTALQPWDPPTLDVLKPYEGGSHNLLVPTISIRQVNPYLVPDIEVVKLSGDPDAGHIYSSTEMKGKWAPTAKGLSLISQVAGIDVFASRRTDDGRDSDVVEWSVLIEMALPSGQRVRRTGSKRIDLHQLGANQTPQWLGKAREHLVANAETKALNRAIRSILSLQGAMPKAQILKPFAILRWVPNMNDPDVRRRMLDNLLPATTAAYGPEPRRIGPSDEIIDLGEAPAVDDEDEVADAQYVDVETNGHTKVDRSTGEIVGEGGPEPDWFDESPAPSAPTETDLLLVLRAAADKAGEQDKTSEQIAKLRSLLTGVAPDGLRAVFGATWPGVDNGGDLSGAQAAAILAVAAQMGTERLRSALQTLGERLGQKAAAA